MKIRCVVRENRHSPTGKAVVLEDENGVLLPGQCKAELITGVNAVPMVRVDFLLSGDGCELIATSPDGAAR